MWTYTLESFLNGCVNGAVLKATFNFPFKSENTRGILEESTAQSRTRWLSALILLPARPGQESWVSRWLAMAGGVAMILESGGRCSELP